MNGKGNTFNLETAHKAVELDVAGVLGDFFKGQIEFGGKLGPATWRSDDSEFFAVGWRFTGTHTGKIPGFGNTFIEPTHNIVSVPGFTLVRNTAPDQPIEDDLDTLLRKKTVEFTRYID